MVLVRGIEPPTPSLPRTCSTPELHQHVLRLWGKPCGSSVGQRRRGASYATANRTMQEHFCKLFFSALDPALLAGHKSARRQHDEPSMTDTAPRLTDKAKKAQEEKQKRLAEALRANLHRRKAQSRARSEEALPAAETDGQDA